MRGAGLGSKSGLLIQLKSPNIQQSTVLSNVHYNQGREEIQGTFFAKPYSSVDKAENIVFMVTAEVLGNFSVI